ncbi:hypothetical protein LG277_13795 [Vreelandella aquamarina]|uniref:hypothetical protein n=1 Tax=Vreelandella aquamarina TaxID=77097 RepID=UPI00384ABF50
MSLLLSLPLGAETLKEKTMEKILIEISGTEDVVYSADWQVTVDGETYSYQEEGKAPAYYAYEGNAIQGSIKTLSEGRLEVTIQKGGNRSRTSTQGKGSTLNIAVR